MPEHNIQHSIGMSTPFFSGGAIAEYNKVTKWLKHSISGWCGLVYFWCNEIGRIGINEVTKGNIQEGVFGFGIGYFRGEIGAPGEI